jgi:trimeric autotransporter adhesin
MKKNLLVAILVITGIFVCFQLFYSPAKKSLKDDDVMPITNEIGNDNEQQDDMDKAIEFEIEKTKDRKLGYVPSQRLLLAKKQQNEKFAQQNINSKSAVAVTGISWAERGPNNIGGRTRAIWFDLNNAPTYGKVWAGGVGGGLWVTNDITAASPVWTKQNDFFDNLAVTTFGQSSSNTLDMYFGTGEGWFNSDAIRGLGIWYSANGGSTWNQLASTNNSSFYFVQKIVVDNAGSVYACTRSGLQKSINKGVSWTNVLSTASVNILPGNTSTAHNDVADIEIAANGDLYCSIGIFSAGKIYRSTNGGTSWSDVTPALTARRIELACAPSNANIVYALFHSNTNNNCNAIQKYDASTATWTAGTVPLIIDQGNNSNFTRAQAWYDLIAAVDPNNENSLYIGGVDALRSDNSGTTWTQMSTWSLFMATGFAAAQNIHADHHGIIYQPGSSAIALWATDGGIYRTINANITTPTKPTWTVKNSGYNVTQYYSVAIHPVTTNYLLGGTQDNGTHRITNAGLGAGTTVSGGDGGFAHIDQEDGNIQISSFTNNNFNVTTNSWASSAFTAFAGGLFINPTDYDDAGKYLYGASSTADSARVAYFRWASPSTNGSFQTFSPVGFPAANPPNSVTIRNVTVSPVTLNRVYFGFSNGAVIRVDNANTAIPVSTTIKSSGSPNANVSCVVIDPSDENHVLITYSNYGANSVLESTNALSATPTWANNRGNLPDMPVRWAIFDPRNSDWAILATELGIWSTDNLNAGTTDWQPTNTGFVNTRVDMLQYRSSDRLLAAATHGRGFFTTTIPASTVPGIKFEKALNSKLEQSSGIVDCRNYTDYVVNMLIENAPTGTATVTLNVKAGNTATPGIDFDFTTNGNFTTPSNVVTFPNGSTSSNPVTIRIYNDAEIEGTENFTLEYIISGATNATRAIAPQTHSFEIKDNDMVPTASTYSGNFAVGTSDASLSFETPFRSNLQKFRIQYLFTAAELTAAGITSAGNISSMTIRVATKNSTKPYNGFTISLGNSTATTLATGFVNPAFTQVYTGNYSSVAGDNTFNFSTPFAWDGTSNVVVNFCFDNAPAAADALSDVMEGTIAPLGTGIRATTFSNSTVGSGCLLGAAFINDVRITATFGATSGNPIETILNTNKTNFISGNSAYYFFAPANTNIINSLTNTSANLGCVTSNIFEAGNTWQTFSGGQRSQKVIEIIPTTNSSASYTVGLYYTAAELAGKAPASLKIAKTSAATMAGANSGNTITATTSFAAFGTGFLFTANFAGFSKFFLIDNTVTLPVSLLSFDGRLVNNVNLLDWSTSAEQNSKEFEIEKSADRTNFYSIGIVPAAGNSNSVRNYSFTDKQVNEFNYYRLKMTDIDRRSVVSRTILLKNPNTKQNVRVVENPFRSNITVRFAKSPQQKVRFELVNVAGAVVYRKEYGSANQITIDLSGLQLSKGTYILTTLVDGKSFTNKLVKQ